MTQTLKDYMRKTERIYKDLAPEYIKAAKEEQKAREGINQTRSSVDLTTEGKMKRVAELEALRSQHKANMNALAKKAKDQAAAVRQEVAERFYDCYHANPAALDMQALELLKSGILSDSEIKHLADTFAGNSTMQRICGKYLEQSSDRNTQALGRTLRANASDPHLRCIDSIIDIGNHCLGGAPLSGSNGAERFFSRFDEMAAPVYAAAPDITAVD